eukprot:766890-Hanusia_phi.AAC.3
MSGNGSVQGPGKHYVLPKLFRSPPQQQSEDHSRKTIRISDLQDSEEESDNRSPDINSAISQLEKQVKISDDSHRSPPSGSQVLSVRYPDCSSPHCSDGTVGVAASVSVQLSPGLPSELRIQHAQWYLSNLPLPLERQLTSNLICTSAVYSRPMSPPIAPSPVSASAGGSGQDPCDERLS